MNPRPVSELRAVAESWVGTPFFPNSRAKGAGVSCHLLPIAMFEELGWLPAELSIPVGSPMQARWRGLDIMSPWLDASPWFDSVLTLREPQAGDLLGYRVRDIIHHLAVALGNGELIDCLESTGTRIARLDNPTYATRLARIWSPAARPRPDLGG